MKRRGKGGAGIWRVWPKGRSSSGGGGEKNCDGGKADMASFERLYINTEGAAAAVGR